MANKGMCLIKGTRGRKKVYRTYDRREVHYSKEHWTILRSLREKAKQIMSVLADGGIPTIVHGSLVRGDVSYKSDIDVVVPFPVSSFKIEMLLEQEGGFSIIEKILAQATPNHAIKGHIYLSPEISVTFPLVTFRERELDFYTFGGKLNIEELLKDLRKPGVDKRLVLIEPTEDGHIESPVIGRESLIAKTVGVSIEVVEERVRVLTRRDEVGRTGVFVKIKIAPWETFEDVLKDLAARNPAVRRRLSF
ncbi:MAG: nucleotidyltransferase domain-containing protein [Candidatus Hodarchaeota archaeon]